MTRYFSDIDPADRVATIEHVVDHLNDQLDRGGLAELTPATVAWLDRMKHALADDEVCEHEMAALDERFCAYLATLPEAEAHAAEAHFMRFCFVAERMPHDGTCPGDWFKANFPLARPGDTAGEWLVKLMNSDVPATVGNRAQRRARHRKRR